MFSKSNKRTSFRYSLSELVPPAVKDDWAKRIANVTYVTMCHVGACRAALVETVHAVYVSYT